MPCIQVSRFPSESKKIEKTYWLNRINPVQSNPLVPYQQKPRPSMSRGRGSKDRNAKRRMAQRNAQRRAKRRAQHSVLERIVYLITRPCPASCTDFWHRFDIKKNDYTKARHILEAEQRNVLARVACLPQVVWNICVSYASDNTIADMIKWIDLNRTKTTMGLFWIRGFLGGTPIDHPFEPQPDGLPCRPDGLPCRPDPCGSDPCWVPCAFVRQIDCSYHKLIDHGHRLILVNNGLCRLDFEVDTEQAIETTEIVATIWCDDWVAWFVTRNHRYLVDTHELANIHLLPTSPVRWITDAPTDAMFCPIIARMV